MPAYSLGTMSAWAVTSNTDQIVSGAKTFQAAATSAIPVSIRAATGQAANLFEAQLGDGTVRATLNKDGGLRLGDIAAAEAAGGWLSIVSNVAGAKPLVIRGATSQTANLQEWQASSGAVVAQIYSSGAFETIGGLIQSNSGNGGRSRITYTSSTGSDGVVYDYGVIYTFNDVSPGTAARPLLGRIIGQGKDSVGNATNYADLRFQISDPTDGSEDGFTILYTLTGGATRESARWGDTNAGYHARYLNYHSTAVTLRAQSMAAGATGSLIDAVNSAGTIVFSVNQAGVVSGGDKAWTIVGGTGAPAFETGWTHYYSATQEPMGFRKLPDGTIKLKGLVKNAAAQAAGSIIFTLPAGYRPAHYMRMPVTTHTNTNGGTARVDIGVGGQVYYITGNVAEMDLSNIIFYGEN